MDPDDLLVIARASGAHGLTGELKVHSFAAEPELLGRAAKLYIGTSPKGARPLTLQAMRKQGKRLVLRTAEITTKEQADNYKGAWIYLPKEVLPPLDDGEYYWFQIIGARVETVTGDNLGRVKSLMDIGPHDVLVVADGKNPEKLIPVIDSVVTEMDVKEGLVTVDPPEGLFEAQGGGDLDSGGG